MPTLVDLVERNLILTAVVELGGARRLLVGYVLRGLARALVFQVCGNANYCAAAAKSGGGKKED
jgi:hypothetical protein